MSAGDETPPVDGTVARVGVFRRRRSMAVWQLLVVAIVVFVVGVAVGQTGADDNNETPDLTADLAAAEQRAERAEQGAEAAAKAARDDASRLAEREAAVNARSAELDEREQAVRAVEAARKLDTIAGDGTYEVGVDINPGRWRSDGSGSTCYWARLRNDAERKILDNNIGGGQQIVVLEAGILFESKGCGAWQRSG